MGTVMGVVQVTVQNAAGPASLGSAAASVQLSRSIGAAAGTALVGAVLFAALALSDPEAASRIRRVLVSRDRRPSLDTRASGTPGHHSGRDSSAFRAAFLTIAAFAAVGMALAWSIPARRL